MKRYLSALLALALCLSAALAEGQTAPEASAHAAASESVGMEAAGKPEVTPAPKVESEPESAPKAEAKPEPAPEGKREGEPAPKAEAEPEPAPREDAPAEPLPELPDADADAAEREGAASPEAGETQVPASGETGGEEAQAPSEGEADPDLPQGELPERPGAEESGEGEPESPAPEGYLLVDGERKSGTLKELLATPGEKTVYLTAKEPVVIEDFPLSLLRQVTLLPDPETFAGEKYVVILRSGEEEIAPEDIEAAGSEEIRLSVCVEEKPAEPGETDDPGEEGEVRLSVAPLNYKPGSWMNWSPEFLLSSAPAAAPGCTFVAIVYDERFIPLSGESYLPTEEGIYGLRFAVINAQGDVLDASERYEMMLDLTPPELSVEVSSTRDYTMTLRAADVPGSSTFPLGGGIEPQVSGVAEFSLDGGESWAPLGEGESVVRTESRRKRFPPHTILVRDVAGNVAANAEEIVLDKLSEVPSYGGWGGGGGSSAPSVPHASGDGDDAPYAAYELELPEGAVDVLTLGGEEIDLGLQIEGEGGYFTAELTSWAVDEAAGGDGEAEPPRDTLVLRAEEEGDASERTYTWRVNGAVLRKLYNSDIQYLLLQAGDAALSLPTVGFTAGTRYAELKMGGTSTSEFDYEIVMRVAPGAAPTDAWNLSADCECEIWVDVAGERFRMLDRDASPEMYPYDVYCGPEDLPDYPYGAYPVMDAAAMELDRQARLALNEAEE